MQVLFYKIRICRELTCNLPREATPEWGVWGHEMIQKVWSVGFFVAQIKTLSIKYTITKALGIESSLKKGVCMGIVLLGETLKDMLAHSSCVLNSARAGLARNIVDAQLTLKYTVWYFAGKCGQAPPLNSSSLASCEWAAKSWLLVWLDAWAMLTPGAVWPSSAAAFPSSRSTAYAI